MKTRENNKRSCDSSEAFLMFTLHFFFLIMLLSLPPAFGFLLFPAASLGILCLITAHNKLK